MFFCILYYAVLILNLVNDLHDMFSAMQGAQLHNLLTERCVAPVCDTFLPVYSLLVTLTTVISTKVLCSVLWTLLEDS